jgi:hypothetical protein
MGGKEEVFFGLRANQTGGRGSLHVHLHPCTPSFPPFLFSPAHRKQTNPQYEFMTQRLDKLLVSFFPMVGRGPLPATPSVSFLSPSFLHPPLTASALRPTLPPFHALSFPPLLSTAARPLLVRFLPCFPPPQYGKDASRPRSSRGTEGLRSHGRQGGVRRNIAGGREGGRGGRGQKRGRRVIARVSARSKLKGPVR